MLNKSVTSGTVSRGCLLRKEETLVTEAVRVPWAGGWAPSYMSLIYWCQPNTSPGAICLGRGLRPRELQIPAPPTGGSPQRPQ